MEGVLQGEVGRGRQAGDPGASFGVHGEAAGNFLQGAAEVGGVVKVEGAVAVRGEAGDEGVEELLFDGAGTSGLVGAGGGGEVGGGRGACHVEGTIGAESERCSAVVEGAAEVGTEGDTAAVGFEAGDEGVREEL